MTDGILLTESMNTINRTFNEVLMEKRNYNLMLIIKDTTVISGIYEERGSGEFNIYRRHLRQEKQKEMK